MTSITLSAAMALKTRQHEDGPADGVFRVVPAEGDGQIDIVFGEQASDDEPVIFGGNPVVFVSQEAKPIVQDGVIDMQTTDWGPQIIVR